VGDSYLLKINWLTDQVEGKILLSTPDPVTDLIWNEDLGKILVGEVGNYGELDGGIDGIDPSTGTAQLIISEEQLGGDISDFVLLSADTGYAGITTTDWSASKVVAFNPSTGEVIKEVYSTGFSSPFDLELDTNGRLFITDRGNITNPGVVVIHTSTYTEITNIEFTLPPYSLCQLESGPAPLNKIFLTLSDFQTGGIGLIDLDNLSPWEPDPSWAKDVASSDALAVFFEGKIFVINRMPQDNISVLEFDENRNLRLINQYSVK